MASSWRSSRCLRSGTAADLNEVVPGGDDCGGRPEPLQEALTRPRARLEDVDAPRCADMREGDPGKWLGRVREDAEPGSMRRKRAERRARLTIGPQEHGRAPLCEAFERRPPVAHAVGRPAVELFRSGASVVRKRPGVVGRDRREPARGVVEEIFPERPRVSERPVEVDGENASHSESREATATPTTTPAVSISQSTGEP